jgi:Holliday junction DNA helicase RuvA
MFEFLKGTIEEKTTSSLVLDVNGVGYLITISSFTSQAIGGRGSTVRILVHFHVREDIQRLYGFSTSGEREAFRQLISISQVGPKVAMSVLSGISVRDLSYAAASGDAAKLKSISGVGPKTAQRLLVELKGKLLFDRAETDLPARSSSADGEPGTDVEREAFDAMIALGYSEAQVMRSLSRVKETTGGSAAVEDWIRKALQVI